MLCGVAGECMAVVYGDGAYGNTYVEGVVAGGE